MRALLGESVTPSTLLHHCSVYSFSFQQRKDAVQASVTSERGAVRGPLGPPAVLQSLPSIKGRRNPGESPKKGRDYKWEPSFILRAGDAASAWLRLHKVMQGRTRVDTEIFQLCTRGPCPGAASLLGACSFSLPAQFCFFQLLGQ